MTKTSEIVNKALKEQPELLERCWYQLRQVGGHDGLGGQLVDALVADASGIAPEPPEPELEVLPLPLHRPLDNEPVGEWLARLNDAQRKALASIGIDPL